MNDFIKKVISVKRWYLQSDFHKTVSKSAFYIVLFLFIINAAYILLDKRPKDEQSGWPIIVLMIGGAYLLEKIIEYFFRE